MAASLIAPVASSLLGGNVGEGFSKTGKRQEGEILHLYKARFNGIFSRDNLLSMKDRAYVMNLVNKVKEHIGFHYLSTEMRVCTLILTELNVFLKMY